MTDTKGKFIAIVGGEGCGKTSVIEFLKKELKGNDIVFTPRAEEIRERIMNPGPGGMTAEEELELFCEARADHVKELIAPALKRGQHVVTDRFDADTFAYQVCGRERPDLLSRFETLNSAAVGEYAPGMYIFLDGDPQECLARRREAGALTRFDKEKLSFHERVSGGHREYVSGRPHVIVNANKSEEEVQQETLKVVRTVLGIV